MKKFARFLACTSLALVGCTNAAAQQQTTTTGPIYISTHDRLSGGHILPPQARLDVQCPTPPSPSEYKTFGHFAQMSLKAAASLNALFGPSSVAVSWSGQSQVMVWRMGITATCISTDKKFMVVYGAEWDSAVAIKQDSLSGKAGFAIIAANAEINNSSTAYDYVAVGYQQDQAFKNWQTANGKLLQDMTVNGLNVSNYATINSDFGATVNLAQQLVPLSPPVAIGFVPVGTQSLSEALARGYAIMFVAKGKNCNEAEKAFPIKEPWVGTTIREVYLQLSAGKDDCKPDADQDEHSIATRLLGGIDISQP